RESRPRSATQSNVPADTAMGFVNTFRFGNPFFLQPNVDELIWRSQLKDNFSIVSGRHTYKFGGEWLHTLNDQVFRGFFTGRYIFDSVTGFLRYAAPTGPGTGPNVVECNNGTFASPGAGACGGPANLAGSALLLDLHPAADSGPTTDAGGPSAY